MLTELTPPRALPSAHSPPLPVSEMQPAIPAFWVSAPSAARSNTATASLTSDATKTFVPSGLTITEMARSRALPSVHSPPLPVSEMQPASPAFWVRAPSAARSNTATAPLPVDVAYTLVPSGLTAAEYAPPRPLPSVQSPPLPVSEMQPAIPAFCVSVPFAARSNTATASLSDAAR